MGEVPVGAVLNPRDPTAYLKHVLHKETLCDIHSDQIRGIWLRCAHCAAGFDICQDAEQIADHDPTHGELVLTRDERADRSLCRFQSESGHGCFQTVGRSGRRAKQAFVEGDGVFKLS